MAIWRSSRRRARRHVGDDMLALLALVGPDSLDDDLLTHVVGCTGCTGRLQAIEASLAGDSRQARVEADQALPAARLEEQRAGILRRIGGSRAMARILPFPSHGPVPVPQRRHVLRRSVAAAAVGGLLIGAAAGRLFDPYRPATRPEVVLDQPGGAAGTVQTVRASASADEIFLRDLEAALGAPQVEPLRALDALTPRPADDAPR